MQFISSQFFLFFIGVFILAMFLKGNKRYYGKFLLIVSSTFYLFFGLKFFAILALNIFINYLLLHAVEKFGKKALALGVFLNVAFLAVFKYFNVGADTLLQILNQLNMPADMQIIQIIIPVGASFYTFRIISHLVDCYRKILPVPTFVDYANYVAFFPQIMSGPIMRAKEFYTNLHNPELYQVSQGRVITLILSGLLKKYVVASYLFNYVSGPFATPINYSSLDLVMAALAYSMMIFVDFSGYSDLAIALSNMLGFDVKPNFASPYRAIGLKDFWNRWHISLSVWLRDYLYIPLGGSRKGTARKYINILLTLFISGFWHGAGLTFVVWGLLHGIGSVISHYITDFINKRAEKPITEPPASAALTTDGEFVGVRPADKTPIAETIEAEKKNPFYVTALKVVGWAVTFIYVTFAWIFFTSPNIETAFSFIGNMFVSTVAEHKIFNVRLLIVILIVLAFNFIGDDAFRRCIKFFNDLPLIARIAVVTIAVYIIFQLGPETVPPFIYFNF